jgi:glycosyltransferase involved in cell wall biosynthesis
LLEWLNLLEEPRIKFAFVSSYPPRECGIATYTKDLFNAISELKLKVAQVVVATDENDYSHNYEKEVRYVIKEDLIQSYVEASDFVNNSDIDVVNLQHEFGLFGGIWGHHIIAFLERIEKPIITTLHTLKSKPEEKEKIVLEKVLRNSDYIVVMSKVGNRILESLYKVPSNKIMYIPHGCPNIPFIDSDLMKAHLGLKDRVVLSTFGLLSQGKGIEYAIKALTKIVEKEPRALYMVIGKTHPKVKKREGENYRKRLVDVVKSLGLEDNVRFINEFLPLNDLIRILQATDIYILPYPNREQISSGTLLYALSAGKAIVTTPFLLAEEIISSRCAMRCEFRNPDSITNCILKILENINIRKRLERQAYKYSRDKTWSNIAMKYVDLFNEAYRRSFEKTTNILLNDTIKKNTALA